jgi:LmbE family N-acetylglucosaminyl deacetylase
MTEPLRLMAVLAHPDDESLGVGGTLVRYAREGVETHLVTATRGQAGRYGDGTAHPGPQALGVIREQELRRAADVLGVRSLSLLDYHDGRLDQADPREAIGLIAGHIRAVRPQVVMTFDPYGGYGHPDHIAICQFTTAAVPAAADPGPGAEGAPGGAPHAVSKFYYMAWDEPAFEHYQHAFKKLVSRVDGIERPASPWPAWAITTRIDARAHWRTVWEAVRCHHSQVAVYGRLGELSDADHQALWGDQTFYRVMSRVNGGRAVERDLFEGLR